MISAQVQRGGVTLGAMPRGPNDPILSHAGRAVGIVDYRLARNAIVEELRRGRLSRRDVCDAHPELLRAARSVGSATSEACPACDEGALVHVTFAFGARLPAGGRCVSSQRDAAQLARRATEVACYVVEVCPSCAWNHLARMFLTGGRSSAGRASREQATGKAP